MIGVLQLTALIFFQVSGGPYGVEEVVAYGGPLFSLVGLIAIPWLWSIWVALLTSELTSLFPVSGSRAAWVWTPFGPGMCWVAIFLGAWSNLLDAALYPVMALAYLEGMDGLELSPLARWGLGSGIVLFSLALNLRGISVVGWANAVFLLIVCSPFVILVAMGIHQISPAMWVREAHPSDVDWAGLLVLLGWNTSGLENFANSVVAVKDKATTIPRALFLTIFISTVIYVLPIAVGLSYNRDYAEWEEGYFVKVAREVGGEWLAYYVLATGVVGSVGLSISMHLCATESFLSLGYAGLVGPSFFEWKSKVPVSLVLVAIALSALITLDFTVIMTLSMTLYCIQLLIFIAAFLRLRWTHGHLDIPFRIPFSRVTLCVIMILPSSICIALLAYTNLFTLAFTASVIALALASYVFGIRHVALHPEGSGTIPLGLFLDSPSPPGTPLVLFDVDDPDATSAAID